MKKQIFIISILLPIFIFILYPFQSIFCQSEYIGTWEGFFMNDFKTIISFQETEDNQYTGNIKMLNIDAVIQDDEITQIVLDNQQLKFFIPAKETSYNGTFNEDKNALSGEFIFPDGSRHALNVSKKAGESLNPIDVYREIKEKTFSNLQLKEDFSFLHFSLTKYHPQLYTYTSKNDIAKLIERLSEGIEKDLTLEEFYVIVSQFTDAVKCSHTGARLSQEYQKLISEFGNYFPLRLYFKNGKAFYITNLDKNHIQFEPGVEIISINGALVKDIISQLQLFIPGEGNNQTTEYNELNKNFNFLFYFLDDSDNYKLEYKSKDSIGNMIIKSCNYSALNLNSEISDIDEPVSFEYMSSKSLGIIKIPSFGIRDMDAYLWKLDSIFSEIKNLNAQNLILDLRDNKGGHPIFAAQILSYLIDHEFTYFKRNDDIPDFEPLYNPMQANPLNFGGNIYVLVNGGCLSTTGHLISLLDYHSNAIFVGEQPGSTFQCNDFSIQLKLPITGIELNVPRTTFRTVISDKELNTQLPIRYKVSSSAVDLINNKDVCLDTVFSILEGQDIKEFKEN